MASYNESFAPVARMDGLICKLHLAIECPVRYPVHNFPIAVCKHGVVFPDYVIRTQDWAAMRRRHEDEMILSDE